MDTSWAFFALAFVGAALVALIIQKRRREKSQLPEVDERVLQLFQTYLLRTIIVSGTLGVILLAIYTIAGHQSIPVNYIWLYLLITMLILSLTAILAKKK